MAAPKPQPAAEEGEDWLVTYADAITLLMAFFVMMLTFAEFDIPAFQEAAEAIKANIGQKEKEASPLQLLKIDMQDVVYNLDADRVVTVTQDNKGIVIELSSSAFYKSGTDEIREQAYPVLEKMALTLNAPKYLNYMIEIEGHTDDDRINTARFPSNWELSAGRATQVVRFFTRQEVHAERLVAVALAATRPKLPNRDENGAAIKENQAVNRRIAVHVNPMSFDQIKEFTQAITTKAKLKKMMEGGTVEGEQTETGEPAPIVPELAPDLPVQPLPEAQPQPQQ